VKTRGINQVDRVFVQKSLLRMALPAEEWGRVTTDQQSRSGVKIDREVGV